jgi:L-lactate permease
MNSILEISFYIVNVLVFYGVLIPRIGANISEKCTNFRDCRSSVRKAWHGLQVDIADGQWREFRNTLPLLCGAAILITLLHVMLQKWQNKSRIHLIKSQHFHLITGMIVLVVQHGWHSTVVLSIICASYLIGRLSQRSRLSIPITWVFACFVIALKESYRIQWYAGYEVFN